MYKVIKFFTDLQDSNYPYEVGSTYPREGLSVSKERIKELSSKSNRQGTALIKEVIKKKIPEKASETHKEDAEDKKTSVNAPKKSKAKKNTRKTQE